MLPSRSYSHFGTAHVRLSAAREWALLSRQLDCPQSLDAFGLAIGPLSQVTDLEQTIHKRPASLDLAKKNPVYSRRKA